MCTTSLLCLWQVWFGAVKGSRGGWEWIDRSKFKFSRWPRASDMAAKGTTLEQQLQHDCGTIGNAKFGYGIRWFTSPCSEKHQYLCKMGDKKKNKNKNKNKNKKNKGRP